MQGVIIRIFKIFKLLFRWKVLVCSKTYVRILFYLNGIQHKSFRCMGIPYLHVSLGAKCLIGENFSMNNGSNYSDSGLNGKCRIEVRENAQLIIGNNVGMSDVTITCHDKIEIGDNVLLGVGTQIRDTDNHSLNSMDRLNGLDWKNKKTAPVKIGENVFIASNVIILKGVSIGSNAIVGAGSVVSKDIPENEIWAGNPAVFKRRLAL